MCGAKPPGLQPGLCSVELTVHLQPWVLLLLVGTPGTCEFIQGPKTVDTMPCGNWFGGGWARLLVDGGICARSPDSGPSGPARTLSVSLCLAYQTSSATCRPGLGASAPSQAAGDPCTWLSSPSRSAAWAEMPCILSALAFHVAQLAFTMSPPESSYLLLPGQQGESSLSLETLLQGGKLGSESEAGLDGVREGTRGPSVGPALLAGGGDCGGTLGILGLCLPHAVPSGFVGGVGVGLPDFTRS